MKVNKSIFSVQTLETKLKKIKQVSHNKTFTTTEFYCYLPSILTHSGCSPTGRHSLQAVQHHLHAAAGRTSRIWHCVQLLPHILQVKPLLQTHLHGKVDSKKISHNGHSISSEKPCCCLLHEPSYQSTDVVNAHSLQCQSSQSLRLSFQS